MTITVVFPEYIFGKAVCELETALKDLRSLQSEMGASTSINDHETWTIDPGHAFSWLLKASSPHIWVTWFSGAVVKAGRLPTPEMRFTSSEELPYETPTRAGSYSWFRAHTQGARTWTLTHCYLVNMGGLLEIQPEPPCLIPITAASLTLR
jgi:hypothetical protein